MKTTTTTAARLGLYGVLLAAVLGGSLAIGAASEPIGLATAEPDPAGHGGMETATAGLPGLAAAESGFRLVPSTTTAEAGVPFAYEFRIEDDEGAVTGFEIEHTKPMHLIVVRRDFAGFAHVHPEMAADGTWSTDLELDDPGAYRVFADFVVDGDKHTLGTDLLVPGAFDVAPPLAAGDVADAGEGYTVELDGDVVAADESTLSFTVRRAGHVVDDIPTYLGARGHLVALRAGDLAYLHVHADEDRLEFEADFPTPGEYRLFLQFQHGGEVRTATFAVDAEEARR